MWGMKHLLILSVFVLLARCQQKPQVSVSPTLKQIFSGDLIFLSCDNSGNSVKWYFKDQEQQQTNKIWKIGVASPKHSGSYQCESNGQKSDNFSIDILNYVPIASLTIKTGQPVVQTGGSVVLQLKKDDGLQGWKCWVYRGTTEGTKRIALRLKNDNNSVVFQPKRLEIPETVFWCSDNEQGRSNQVIVRTSEKEISLEMYPLPAIVGESLSLRCLAWGTDQISSTVFYKNNAVLMESRSPTHEITNVTESTRGSYHCNAIFKHKAHTDGPPSNVMSDDQDVFVQLPPMRAVLSANNGMSCSCPQCPGDKSYRWYYEKPDESWAVMNTDGEFMMPKEGGTYACRAVWATGRTLLSNSHVYKPMIASILIGVIVVLVILCSVAVLIYIYHKKRNTTGPIYEDMPLRSRDKDDDQYEGLQTGAQREGEYDTINPEAPGREKKEGQYEALKKEGMTSGEYDTVRMEGAVGGESGYEALKREGMKEGEYHTLGMEGAEGGGKEGGYEALKREGMKEGEYNTLGMEGAEGGARV